MSDLGEGKLQEKAIKVLSIYLGTFIIVMILNQLLFFGFCLSPSCIIAATPHVLLIAVVVGVVIQRLMRKNLAVWAATGNAVGSFKNALGVMNESLQDFNKEYEATQSLRERRRDLMNEKIKEMDLKIKCMMGSGSVDEVRKHQCAIDLIDAELMLVDQEIEEAKRSL